MTKRAKVAKLAVALAACSVVAGVGCGSDDASGAASVGGSAGSSGAASAGGSAGSRGGGVACEGEARANLTERIAFAPQPDVRAGKGDSFPIAGVLLGDEIVFLTEKLWLLPKTGGSPRVMATLPEDVSGLLFGVGGDRVVLFTATTGAIQVVSKNGSMQTLTAFGSKQPTPSTPLLRPYAGVRDGALQGLTVIPETDTAPARIVAVSRDLATDAETDLGYAPNGYRCGVGAPSLAMGGIVALCSTAGFCKVSGGTCKLLRFSTKGAEAEVFDTPAGLSNPSLIGVLGNDAIITGLGVGEEKVPLLAVPLTAGGASRELARYTRKEFESVDPGRLVDGGLLAPGSRDLFIPEGGGAIVETAIFADGALPKPAFSILLGADGCAIYRVQIETSPSLTYQFVRTPIGSP